MKSLQKFVPPDHKTGKEGIAALLVQAGLSEKCSVICETYKTNWQHSIGPVRHLGTKMLPGIFIGYALNPGGFCADGFLGQESHGQRQILRHERAESFDAGGLPFHLCNAQGVTLCRKKAELQTFGSRPGRCGRCLEKSFVATMSFPNSCEIH